MNAEWEAEEALVEALVELAHRRYWTQAQEALADPGIVRNSTSCDFM